MSQKPKVKLSVVASGHPIYDKPSKWSSAGIFVPPTHFDKEAYQLLLDEIFGTANGRSICRVSWAWEQRKWWNYTWDEFGNATKGEWRQKYTALTVEVGGDEYVDVSPPRWVLEERFEPGQYEKSWESSRYVHDPSECTRCVNRATLLQGIMSLCVNRLREDHAVRGCGTCQRKFSAIEESTTCTRRDVWGPAPRDGWYNLVPHIGMVAQHESSLRCCDRLWKQSKEICYGRYKVPGSLELQVLRRAKAERDANPEVNPHMELDEQSLEHAKSWGLQAMREMKVKSQSEAKERWKSEVDTHGAKICLPHELAALKSMGAKMPHTRDYFPLTGKPFEITNAN
jgi:hypothetical protein